MITAMIGNNILNAMICVILLCLYYRFWPVIRTKIYQTISKSKKLSKSKGKKLVAIKDYEPGDVILTEEPFIFMLDTDLRGKRCDTCLKKSSSLKLCIGCNFLYYCSSGCQEKDWEAHHKYDECKVFKDIRNQNIRHLDTFLFDIRVYLTIRGRPALKEKRFPLTDGTSKSFNDMMSNVDVVKNNRGNVLVVNSISKYLSSLLPDYSEDDFFEIHGKVYTNSSTLREPNYIANFFSTITTLAECIFIQYSHINHSCRPNSNGVTKGMNNELRATTKIKAGEEITVSYVNLKMTRNERRQQLKLRWFFECECVRCKNDDDDKVLEMNKYYNSTSMSEPNRAFKLLLKYCDLVDNVLGKGSLESAVPLVNLYSIAFLCQKDKEELNRIYKRAEEVVLVTYGLG